MRIMHLCAPAPFGGLERVIQMLSSGQSQAGHQVDVLAVLTDTGGAAEDHPFVRELTGMNGVRVHPLSLAARSYREERRQINQLCRKIGPNVFHTHGYRSDVVHAPVARQCGIPTITTVHGFTGGDWKMRLYEKLQERAFRSFSAVVAVSRPIRGRLLGSGVPAGRLHLLQNAWSGKELIERSEARSRLGLGPGRNIGWIGRLSREKGPDVALEALALLRDEELTLCLVGDGPEREAMERRASERGMADRVRFLGAVADAGAFIPAFDALILSSRTEGTPIVLLEAMAAEVPIVATAVGGVPQMLTSAEALLVPPDDPRSLAEAIHQTLAFRQRSAARTVAAKARLRKDFEPSAWVRSYDEIYNNARSQHQRRPAA